MQNQNIIDISELPHQEQLLALDFFEFLKFKSRKSAIESGNYDKIQLIKAINLAKESGVFEDIEDSVIWQQELRNEWE